ncbi:hypothetical protein SUDANB108_03728 [Streptomyces sp. enrichment culture]|uniref:hypothetical protein n=1 Tax=Streptomyces sp. enrichment culture TaxID=1795815 RepID=UPI003F556FD8
MTTRLDDVPGEPESGPDDPLAVILRPSSPDYLGAPPGQFETVRRRATRRRLLRTAAGAGLCCAVAALVVLPLRLSAPEAPAVPTVPMAPPPATRAPATPAPAPSEPDPTAGPATDRDAQRTRAPVPGTAGPRAEDSRPDGSRTAATRSPGGEDGTGATPDSPSATTTPVRPVPSAARSDPDAGPATEAAADGR